MMNHVIIAEPNEVISALTQRAIVCIFGWSVDLVRSGRQALELIEEMVPDLLIAEVSLPDLSGFNLVTALKNNPVLDRIPVLLMGLPERKAEALSAGCNGYVAKPFDLETLIGKIRLL